MLIFIYGTLKENMCNHSILKDKNSTFYSKGTTIQKYPMYKSPHYFPYLENQPGIGYNIIGEVWKVTPKKAEYLDYFEGVPELYIRGSIEVQAGDELLNCICYFKTNNSSLKELEEKKFINQWVE